MRAIAAGFATFMLVFAFGGVLILKAEVSNLRKDVNRVSNIQIQCADSIAKGFYEPDMMDQCIDDYIRSG